MSAARGVQAKRSLFSEILYGEQSKSRWILEKAWSAYPTLLDDAQRNNIDYGVAGVPETFVIGRDGTIVKKYTGPVTKMELEVLLNGLLAK